MIKVELQVFTAKNGRQSVLKSREEVERLITDLRKQQETTERRAKAEESFINRVFYEDRADALARDIALWEEYQKDLSTWQNTAKSEVYYLLIPDYDSYLSYQDAAKTKDDKGRPGTEINLSKLMAETLPRCLAVEDNSNEDGYRRLPVAEAKKIAPFIAEALWPQLYLGIHPSQSVLPTYAFRS